MRRCTRFFYDRDRIERPDYPGGLHRFSGILRHVTAGDQRQAGSTPSERLVAVLCEQSFLSLWSYPNVYHDQGRPGAEDGKELCDLIAVFRDDVLLVSVKDCAFPTGDVLLAWRRWYRRAVEGSVKQLYAAERWVRNHPRRLYLDRRCTQRFPIDLPPPDRIRVHRIAVAMGATGACQRHYRGTSGSLLLAPMEPSPLAPHDPSILPKPFVLGRVSNPFVHVFDDFTLPLVMQELDTAIDFFGYLRRKEALIANQHLLISLGEEHLLAYYLRAVGVSEAEEFPIPPEGRVLAIDEDLWPGLVCDPAYIEMKQSLRGSYAWDKMIERLSQDILFDRMMYETEDGPAGHERNVRALASAPRLVRRDLAPLFFTMLQEKIVGRRYRAVIHPDQPDTAYLFLVMARGDSANDGQYRKLRVDVLGGYAMIFARRHTNIRHVIGISIGPAEHGDDEAHEVVYIDRNQWTPDRDALAAEIENEFYPSR
jgi:hypothetical protein